MSIYTNAKHNVCFQKQKAGATPSQASKSYIQDSTCPTKSPDSGFSSNHDTRNKKLIEFLHSQSYCVSFRHFSQNSYSKCCCRKCIKVWWDISSIREPLWFFAVDNTDFAEETDDGNGTTHRTIVSVVYQKDKTPDDVTAPDLELSEARLFPHIIPTGLYIKIFVHLSHRTCKK